MQNRQNCYKKLVQFFVTFDTLYFVVCNKNCTNFAAKRYMIEQTRQRKKKHCRFMVSLWMLPKGPKWKPRIYFATFILPNRNCPSCCQIFSSNKYKNKQSSL